MTAARLRSFSVGLLGLLLVACGPVQIPMYNVYDQSVPPGLTQDQVAEKIELAVKISGWSVQEASPGRMLAVYRIRTHTVIVAINYNADAYSIDHYTSYHMKVLCTEQAKLDEEPPTITNGPGSCPGDAQPAYIHQNYKVWVEQLNTAILRSLQT
jgi:hypothetical protein